MRHPAPTPPRRERRRLRRLLRRMLRVSAAAATLFPALSAAPVHAEDPFWSSASKQPLTYGAGAFVGYQFGEHSGFEWGLEAFATHRESGLGCSSEPRWGFGPLLQLAVRGTRDPRLTLAAQGGGELQRGYFSLTGELGLTYRFGVDPGFGVHIGAANELSFLTAALRYQALRNEFAINGGARVLPAYGMPGSCAVGRPLRAADGCRPLGLDVRPPSAASARELAGAAWARDAALECASIPAFLQLAEQLLVAGAPLQLAERAIEAAADELEHTRACAALASRWSGRPIQPALPPYPRRPAVTGSAALRRLAIESWTDGCIAEGVAARAAAEAAAAAREPEAARVQQQIAVDERRHAELAWSILQWTADRGGEDTRAAIHAVAAVPSAADDEMPSGLERFGRIGPRAHARLAQRERSMNQERLARLGL